MTILPRTGRDDERNMVDARSAQEADSEVADVCVVIVSYNCRDLLRRCLRCVPEAVGGHRADVLVVDNGSTDDSAAMVSAEFADCQLTACDANTGFARAANMGLSGGRGRHLLLLNPDTAPRPGSISELIEFLDGRPSAGAVGAKLLNEDGTTQPSVRRFPSLWTVFLEASGLQKAFPRNRILGCYKMEYWDHSETTQVDQPSGACLLLKGKALESVGLLDEGFHIYFEEVDWCRRARLAGWEIWFHPDAEVIHIGGGSSASDMGAALREMFRSRLIWFRKHRGRTAAAFVLVASIWELSLKVTYWAMRAALRGDEYSRRMRNSYGSILKKAATGQLTGKRRDGGTGRCQSR